MFKWMDQIQLAKAELQTLAASKSSKEFEKKMEALLEKLSTNPQFLNALSFLLNTQSQVKSVVNFSFEKLWKNLQLPNKKDQERTLYLLHEMQFKMHQLEKEVLRLRSLGNPEQIQRKTGTTDSRPLTVIDKRKTEPSVSKLV